MTGDVTWAVNALFPGDMAAALLRLDRLTTWEVRRAYDNRVKELHPGWSGELDESEIQHRESDFHNLTAAYVQLLAHLREQGAFDLTVGDPTVKEETSARKPAGEEAVATEPILVAVAGAREAIGTSLISGLISAALAGAGHECLAVDLGGSGTPLSRFLGVGSPEDSFEALLAPGSDKISRPGRDTLFKRLRLVGGSHAAADMRLAGSETRRRFVRGLRSGDHGFAVLDLGDSRDLTSLDLLASADVRLLVATTDPRSLQDAYVYLNKMVGRLLSRYYKARLKPYSIERPWFEELLGGGSTNGAERRTPRWLLTRLIGSSPAVYREVSAMIRAQRIDLVLNHTRSRRNTSALVHFIAMVKNDLDLGIQEIHSVPDDKRIYAAIRRAEPVLTRFPDSRAARAVYRCAQKIFFPDTLDAAEIIRYRIRTSAVVRSSKGESAGEVGSAPRRLRVGGLI